MGSNARLEAVRDEVASLEKSRLNLLVLGDAAGLAALMSDDCAVVHGSGVMENKAEFLMIFERMDIHALDQDAVNIRVFDDDTAVIISTTTMRSTFKSTPASEINTCHHQTTVWRRDAGNWRFNTLHNTRIPQVGG